MHSLSAWPERRPPRTEAERAAIADDASAHLPKPEGAVSISDADLDAMRAAFIRRFDEQLPRTETLMAVAHIGYRIALRDAATAPHKSTALPHFCRKVGNVIAPKGGLSD